MEFKKYNKNDIGGLKIMYVIIAGIIIDLYGVILCGGEGEFGRGEESRASL